MTLTITEFARLGGKAIEPSKTYWIFRDGTIKRKDGHTMSKYVDNYGYYVVDYRLDGKRNHKRVHVLLAKAFIPNPRKLRTISHINLNKLDNSLENLEWASDLQNIRHGFKNGAYKNVIGSRHYLAKLTEKDIPRIRSMPFVGKTHEEIAKEFGVSRRHITDIINRVCWKHV